MSHMEAYVAQISELLEILPRIRLGFGEGMGRRFQTQHRRTDYRTWLPIILRMLLVGHTLIALRICW